MALYDLSAIEFRNDGVSDSLTLTMSPSLFHESLKREIATASRENRDLAVLSISLEPEHFSSVSGIQEELVKLAFLLRTQLRGGDFFARISDLGFWVLLRTDEASVEKIVERLGIEDQPKYSISVIARKHDRYDEWIKRIDLIHFPQR
jgi:GGDEF domain-containing protein